MNLQFLKYGVVVAAAFSVSMLAQAQEGQSNNNPSAILVPGKTPDFPSCWVEGLTFNSAQDTFSFSVAKTEDTAAGILRVRTRDCCLAGDEWQAEIAADKPKYRTDVNSGDGNTATYTGGAYVAPFIEGTVTISYDVGVDSFPAGMNVEFCYSREREDGADELSIIAQ